MKCFVFLVFLVVLVENRPQYSSQRSHRRLTSDYPDSHPDKYHRRRQANNEEEVLWVYKDGGFSEIPKPREGVPLANKPENNRSTRKGPRPQGERKKERISNRERGETRIINIPKKKDVQSDFVFPTEDDDTTPPLKFVPDVPPHCKGATFCNETVFYPADHIRTITNRIAKYQDFLGTDEIQPEIITRIDLKENPMCASVEQVVFPKIALTDKNQWSFLVNEGDNEQGVRVEICMKNDQKCELSESFPLGYEGNCKQKYIYRKMLALNNKGDPEPKNIKLPSCCSCFYSTTDRSLGKRQTTALRSKSRP